MSGAVVGGEDMSSRLELSREEILVEMGLGPVWCLRAAAGEVAGEAAIEVDVAPVPESIAETEDSGAAGSAPPVVSPVPRQPWRREAVSPPAVPAPASPVPPSPVGAASTPAAGRQGAADAVAAARALLQRKRDGEVASSAHTGPAMDSAAQAFDDGPPLSIYGDVFVPEDDEREPLPPDDLLPVGAAAEDGSVLSPQARRAAEIAALDWEALEARIRACGDCVLCQQRQQAVPGVGDRRPDWLFIGEGPGADEDVQGEPFVGQAGKLLDAMLAAIDLKRGEKVYIANAVKCRPPGNRTPQAEEIATCWPYLQRQIALLQPRLIVLLGRPAVAAVLGEEASIASLRGKRLSHAGIPVLVTYHPAYLLRNLPDKAKAWEDLCRARAWMRELQAG